MRRIISIILVLLLLLAVTTVLMISFTFAGNPEVPDVTAKYRRNELLWDAPTNVYGVALLDLFGEPEQDEELPLIHPFSEGTYNIRLDNLVQGTIGYDIYLYAENPHAIPLEFKVQRDETMREADIIPQELTDKEILDKFSGTIGGRERKNFQIDWKWETESDEKDTEIGDEAVGQVLEYKFNVMIVVEDNNFYTSVMSGTDSAGVKMRHRAYIKGYPDGEFKPEGSITRAEVSAIFARILSNYDESLMKDRETDFSDVVPSRWYSMYIAKLLDCGVITGYDDGLFRPDRSITRAEFATMCIRFFELRIDDPEYAYEKNENRLNPDAKVDFYDIPEGHWAREYIDKAAKREFVNGYPDGSFKPDAFITRAEAVTIVNRMLCRYYDKNYIDWNYSELLNFSDLTDSNYWAYYEIFEAANEHHTFINIASKSEDWFGVLLDF